MAQDILPFPSILTVEELDGSPLVDSVQAIKVSNGTLTDNGDGSVTINTSGSFTNPMTTQDDLIIGGASGTPTRLAKGSDGYVLTVDPSTHHLVWAATAVTGHTIQDEGTPLTQRVNLNFVGTNVAATDDAGNSATKVTINRWYPLGNGDPVNPSLIFAAGAPVMVEQL